MFPASGGFFSQIESAGGDSDCETKLGSNVGMWSQSGSPFGDLGGLGEGMRRSCREKTRLTQPPALPLGRVWPCPFGTSGKQMPCLHFFGEAPERRPWALKGDDRPAGFAGRSELRSSR